ncbi:hypothetical protein FRC00_002277 [Tulasnella sp. 408]|nr:hypothetical protein FRC00_002277 [Tulasnella sp. 408]
MQGPEEPLFFHGNGARECENFVNTVNRYAWKSGKSEDSKWIAHFAMSCLTGKALRWAMQLDKDTRKDWDLLSAALLLNYTEDAEGNEAELRSSMIPTPAKAPMPPATELIRGNSRLGLRPLCGRIRIDTDRSYLRGYVSRDLDSFGMLIVSPNPDNAIKVQWTPESSPNLMRVLTIQFTLYMGPNPPRQYYFEVPSPTLNNLITRSAALTCTTKPNPQGRLTSLRKDGKTQKPVTGKSRAAIWSVLADLTIIPIVEEAGC